MFLQYAYTLDETAKKWSQLNMFHTSAELVLPCIDFVHMTNK